MSVQLRQLRYFAGIVDAGSFSRAALTLHVAQPALSQQIADLELDLGVSLLTRSPRGVLPTIAGGLLYKEAISILGRVGQLPDMLRTNGPRVEGTVGIGITYTSSSLLRPFMQLCREAFPEVILRCSVGNSVLLRSRFDARNLNFACAFEDEPDCYFERRPLFRQTSYLVSRAPLAGLPQAVSLADLASLPLVLPSAPNVLRSKVDRLFEHADLTADVRAESDHMTTMLEAVQLGIGHAVLPKGDFSEVPEMSGLVATPIDPKIEMTASVIWPAGETPTPAAEAVRELFIKFAVEQLGRKPARGAELLDDRRSAHKPNGGLKKLMIEACAKPVAGVAQLRAPCGIMKAVA
jgi:LysR family transcriptional regulator, nitrogen assimilation regulatory protein